MNEVRLLHNARRACTVGFGVLVSVLLTAAPARGHDSPIDHIDRVVQVYVEGGRLHVIYQYRCEERQAMLQLHRMDADRDGRISEEEREAYFKGVAELLTKQLRVEVDGRVLGLTPDGVVKLGADLSQTYHLSAAIGELAEGKHAAKFGDDFSRTHPGPYRWTPRQADAGNVSVVAAEAPRVEQAGGHASIVVTDLTIEVRKPPAKAR